MPDDLRQRYAEAATAAHKAWVPSSVENLRDRRSLGERVAEAVLAVRDEEMDRLRGLVAHYENTITWNTTCHGCAAYLDSGYAETVRAEKAEAVIARVRELHHVHRCDVDGHVLARTPNPCLNDGICSGCGSRECATLAALAGEPGEVSDGHGNVWPRCSEACDLHVVRPGKVQCSCEFDEETP